MDGQGTPWPALSVLSQWCSAATEHMPLGDAYAAELIRYINDNGYRLVPMSETEGSPIGSVWWGGDNCGICPTCQHYHHRHGICAALVDWRG